MEEDEKTNNVTKKETSSNSTPVREYLNQHIRLCGRVFKLLKTKQEERTFGFWMNTSKSAVKILSSPQTRYDANYKTALANLKVGDWIICEFNSNWSEEDQDYFGQATKIEKANKQEWFKRTDNSVKKRTEIIMHTNMSAFDGLDSPTEIVERIKDWGWNTICVTDLNCVQTFPEFAKLADEKLKVIYGIEFNVVPKEVPIVLNANTSNFDDKEYVVFDLETTGLTPITDNIIEFAGIKYKGNTKINEKSFLIKTDQQLSQNVINLTKITDQLLQTEGEPIKEALTEIVDFIGDATLIAHNGICFDLPFLNVALKRNGFKPLKNEFIDTLRLSWALDPDSKSHKLEAMARRCDVTYDVTTAHRALADVKVLYEIWRKKLEQLRENGIFNSEQLNQQYINLPFWSVNKYSFPVYVYAKNQEGIKLIYSLLSEALTGKKFVNNSHFPENDSRISIKSPRVSMQDLIANHQNLVIVNNPVEGDLINEIFSGNDETVEKIIKLYDFIAISPPSALRHKLTKENITTEEYQKIIENIIKISEQNNKKCIASSDAYYLIPWQKRFHEALIYTRAIGGKRHRFYEYQNSDKQIIPDLYLRNTQDMLNEFQFLKKPELIENIVINNSQNFANLFEHVEPIPKEKFSFKNEVYEKNLIDLTWKNAKQKYGNELHPIIQKRIERELNSIIQNDYSTIFWISHLLVEESEKHLFPVGSRGSVGSSLVAMLLNISEVNPLPSHYLCNNCHNIEFTPQYEDGFDLPTKQCTKCNQGKMVGDGHNILFETFMGLHGEKVPDIDLNFSGLYQTKAHDFVRKEFGEEHVLRAGTIATIAEKTAFGYARMYFIESGKKLSNHLLTIYAESLVGIKRTTGQHPGGIIIFPKNLSILDFTPVNYPADDTDSSWLTTHFSYEYLHDSLLKFDLLGHDDPTMLKKMDETVRYLNQVQPELAQPNYNGYKNIPNNDPRVLSLFRSTKALNLSSDDLLGETTGAIGLPEFGTSFVRQILKVLQPSTFADLIHISGLAHGTNVWLNNAQQLIKKGYANLTSVISCRDDIMSGLTRSGISPENAFSIMENVRKGKSLNQQEINLMRQHDIPEWYIDSCKKIKYLFPKAHSTAYTLMAWRIAWYKVYYPLAYYSAQFSYKITEHDIKTLSNKDLVKGREKVINKLQKLRAKDPKTLKPKEVALINTYEVALEMFSRNIGIRSVSITESDACEYLIDTKNNKLIAPFIAVEGLGAKMAESIVSERKKADFKSIEDLKKRTKITKTALLELIKLGAVENLVKSSALNFLNELKPQLKRKNTEEKNEEEEEENKIQNTQTLTV